MSILRPFDKDFDKSSPNRNIAPITTELDSKQSLLIQSNSSYLPEPDLFLAISMLIVMMIVIINNLRNIIQHYLIEYRR